MRKQILTFGLGLLLLATFIVPLSLNRSATAAPRAAPQAAPTPVAGVVSGNGINDFVEFFKQQRLTSSRLSQCIANGGYRLMDLQYRIDQGTVNTATVTISYTNDLVSFAPGATVVSNNAADGTAMQQYPLNGVYTCVHIRLANTNAFTANVNAKRLQ